MALIPYYVKVKVFCADENEARGVQNAVNQITSSTNLIGGELYTFFTAYKENESTIKPIISDVLIDGTITMDAIKRIYSLRKIFKQNKKK